MAALSDSRRWSLDPWGLFSVKLLSKHFAAPSPIVKEFHSALRKYKSPEHINGSLNCCEALQTKLPSYYYIPSICPLCMSDLDAMQHFFFVSLLKSMLVDILINL